MLVKYNREEVAIDVTTWKSTIDNRIEFLVVFVNQQETFVNFVKRTGHSDVYEEAASADLTEEIKANIKDLLIHHPLFPDHT